MKKTFGVDNLVDYSGDVMSHDADDEADMCEMIRALIHTKKV